VNLTAPNSPSHNLFPAKEKGSLEEGSPFLYWGGGGWVVCSGVGWAGLSWPWKDQPLGGRMLFICLRCIFKGLSYNEPRALFNELQLSVRSLAFPTSSLGWSWGSSPQAPP
jgi:hypothetical protein